MRTPTAGTVHIGSPIFDSFDEARESMARMRSTLAELVATMGLRLFASSTHPLRAWREQAVTEKPRYDQLTTSVAYAATPAARHCERSSTG